ncbi:calcium-activated chloride channel regulator 2-like [Ixodes scapularis]
MQALFRKASAFLLAATKGKFYFKEVIISVPSSWPPMGRKKVWEDLFNQADVQVASGLKEPDTLNPSRSFPGDFNPVRLPPEFVRDLNSTTTKKFGKPEYHLIHHWANHRYGVFAEHASSPDKAFYCSRNKMEATRCTDEIRFKLSDATGSVCPKNDACMDMSDLCEVTFHQDKQPAPASIMFLPYLNGVSQFCDQDTHNPDATNLQNERHQGLSTWDVISKHDDFIRVKRKLTVNRKIHTKFQEVQQAKKKGKRILFVLDASFSMLENSRIKFLRYSFGHLIRHVINDDESVGIVRFNGSCEVLQHLTRLSSSGARRKLADEVERLNLSDWTSIGCGLRLGIKELESTGTLASGGTIILISDGEENQGPFIADQLPRLVAKGVTVHTFALGSQAEEKLQDLALQTGGTAYAFGDLQKNSISSMGISFVLSTTTHLEDSQKPVFLVETTVDLDSKTSVQKIPFAIPKELGKDTYVTASITEEKPFKVYLLGPTGVKCISECTTETLGPLMVQVKLPETTKTETWTVVLEKKRGPVNVSVVVMTKQRGHEDAIRAESCIRHVQSTNMIVIYSRVTKGGFRVLNANVTATVTLPGKDETVFLPLRDDGKGADVKADDGEYASYFTRYQKKGRYSVRTDVTVDPSAVLGPARPGTNAPPPPGILRAARLRRGPGKMCAASNSSPECKKKSLGKLAEKRLPFRPRLKGSMRRGHRYTETWTVVLEKKRGPVNVSVVVMTKQRGHEDAIRAESCIRHVQSTNMIVIYSRVTKGGFRVLNANVTATVTLPGKDETVFLPLRDDGKGADVKADDGEYASYFTRYQKKGRYSVRTDVTVDPSAVLGPARPGTNAPPPPGILRAARLRRGPGKMCAASNSSPECKKKSLGKLAEQRLPFRPRSKGSMRRGHRYESQGLFEKIQELRKNVGKDDDVIQCPQRPRTLLVNHRLLDLVQGTTGGVLARCLVVERQP